VTDLQGFALYVPGFAAIAGVFPALASSVELALLDTDGAPIFSTL